jgi:hypothetical protein
VIPTTPREEILLALKLQDRVLSQNDVFVATKSDATLKKLLDISTLCLTADRANAQLIEVRFWRIDYAPRYAH